MTLKKMLTYLAGTMMMAILSVSFISLATAWGPDRPTFSINSPATYVTFNSITDNPAYGDERNFLRLKEASASSSTYSDETTIVAGKEYEAYVYFHNNASATFNDASHNHLGIARNTKMRIAMPGVLKAGQRTGMTGYISADNANPGTVHDDTFMTSETDVVLRFLPGTANIYSWGSVDGQQLSDSIVTDGVLLGYNSLDGNLPGCHEFAGYVKFRFKAVAPDFSVTKQVSEAGKNKWTDNVSAKPGDTVDFLISYKNTGTVQQDNVVIQDTLPQGLSYVAGSSFLANSGNPNGIETDDGVTDGGINVGSYSPNGDAYLKFSATVGNDLPACGPNTLRNVAKVITANGNKTDEATVTTEIVCEPDECLPGIPHGDERCNVTPVTELPSTGPLEWAVTAMMVALVALVGTYWYRSRRQLRNALSGAGANNTTTSTESSEPATADSSVETTETEDNKTNE